MVLQEESTLLRRWNAEVGLGAQWGTAETKAPDEFGRFREPQVDSQLLRISIFLTGGVHIPLHTLGKSSTLWLVANPGIGLGIGNRVQESGEIKSEMLIMYQMPVHVTAAIGGLRRKSVAWGIEGGLGFNLANEFGEWVFAPSLLIDLTYAPKNLNRLRFMMDILPASVVNGGGYRRFSLAYIWGIM